MNPKHLTLLVSASTGIILGITIVQSRAVIGDLSPSSLGFLRYALAFLFLLPFGILAAKAASRYSLRDLAAIALLGIAQFGIVILLMNIGLQYIPSGRAALIYSASPLLTLAIAALMKHDRFSTRKIIGISLAIFGVALAIGERAFIPATDTGHEWLGDGAVFLSTLTASLCAVLYGKYVRKYSPRHVSLISLFAAVSFLLIAAFIDGSIPKIPQLEINGWLIVGSLGMTSAAGLFLWLWALGLSTATKVNVFLTLNPITAAGLGALLLGEEITVLFVAGLIAVIAGTWLTFRSE